MIRWLKYVSHSERAAYEAAGWVYLPANRRTPHDIYGITMEWVGEGEPPKRGGEQ